MLLRTVVIDTDRRSAQLERLEVVDTGRRRRWSEDEKLKIVLESLQAPRQVAATSVSDFLQANHDAGRFGLMCSQFSEVRIAPIRETYDLSFLSFHPRDLEQLQYI